MTTPNAGGDEIMVWGMFSWSTLGLLISVDTTLNSATYLNIVADHVNSFMAIMFPEMVTFSRTMELATMLGRSQIGLGNINKSLTCFYSQLSPLTSILWSICGTKSEYRFEAWKRHHPI
ncbi:hypothetical protein AVEN_271116-1 [Araneus ventricosus]|uniref:Uncharacterized protein n=1 Tax=Araneus ventricosus TaxID=182803 RepID=A0A4Y2E3Q7_ARAVE|nr:hypothetical protein AVEN_271116-1 [Araneus ventricosus]